MASETSAECLDLMRARLRRLRADAFIDFFDPAQLDALEGGAQEVRVVILSSESISQVVSSALKSSPCEMTVVILPKATRDPERPDRLWSSVLTHTDEESVIRALTT